MKEVKEVKDIREFEKLFKVNVPIKEHFKFYLSTLALSKEFEKLPHYFREFIKMESDVEKAGYSSISNYKMSFAFKVLKEYIEQSSAYEKFMNFDYSKVSFRTKDDLKKHQGEQLVSLDIKEANFNTLKAFDLDNSEIADSWSEQCINLNVNYGLSLSKSFRQLVFGNINPKRNQKIQHMFILSLIERLYKNDYVEDDIVFISHDEVVIKRKEGMWLYNGMNGVREPFRLFVNELLDEVDLISIPIKTVVFKLDKIKDTKVFVKTIYGNVNYGFAGKHLLENHKELWGVPGNKFYMFFRKHILNFDVYDERDLLFINDGMKAQWILK